MTTVPTSPTFEPVLSMNNACALCLKTTELKLSHIVPKFVWRWLKESSASSIRSSREPDLRIQDGLKIHLLCAECEQRFSDWEKRFAEKVFLPLNDPEAVIEPIHYEEWALKFAVSVSWRVLTFFNLKGHASDFSPRQNELADVALETWRKFLLGEVSNPGNFEQHLHPVDVLTNYEGPKISSYLNRYLLRTIDVDVISTSDSTYVYIKMCRLILFGRIEEKYPRKWKGMQLHLRKGDIRPRTYYCAPGWVADYLSRKADETKNALESVSPKQQAIIDTAFHKNVDAIAQSETFRAMQSDVAHSGKEAFSMRKKSND